MTLRDRISELKRMTSSITSNPILDAIDLDKCRRIDEISKADNFVNNRKKSILNLARNLNINFDPRYKSIYDTYSEIMLYLRLKEKYQIEAIKEGLEKTPDFKIIFEDQEIYIELKSLSFSDGNENYKKAMEDALEANIEIENSFHNGHKMGFEIYSIEPLKKSNKISSPHSVKYSIDEIISKISQNIKRDQYGKEDTILMIDMKQLIIPSKFNQASVSFFRSDNSIVSGILWNVAFGKVGNFILKPGEWCDRKNIEGQLEQDGILVKHEFISGLVFICYDNANEPQFYGFFRSEDERKTSTNFIADISCFINNDVNFYGYQVVQER